MSLREQGGGDKHGGEKLEEDGEPVKAEHAATIEVWEVCLDGPTCQRVSFLATSNMKQHYQPMNTLEDADNEEVHHCPRQRGRFCSRSAEALTGSPT